MYRCIIIIIIIIIHFCRVHISTLLQGAQGTSMGVVYSLPFDIKTSVSHNVPIVASHCYNPRQWNHRLNKSNRPVQMNSDSFNTCVAVLELHIVGPVRFRFQQNTNLFVLNKPAARTPHPPPQKKSLRFLVSACIASDLRISIFSFLFFIAAKIAVSIGILPCCVLNDFYTWTFAKFVRPLLATILCVWEIWSGSNNHVYMYHVLHWLAKKDYPSPHKKRITAPILNDLWLNTG